MSTLDVDAGEVRDVFVRHIPHDGDPLYEPPDPADGRWQHGATVAAWYLADEPATAWAEWYRALAGTGLPPAHALPRDLWRWRVDLDHVALLDDDRRLGRVGLPPPLPSQEQWPACQDVGDALHTEGYEALLVASAARPGQRALVVFRTAHHLTRCTPVPPPTEVTDVPPVPRGMRT
ncbi:MAG: RES family NAD+ phosphorylase [Acidimicrobiales bacterium]